jgi:hypothetical protein
MRRHSFWPLKFCPMRYPDEMSCFFGPLRALRMRYHNSWFIGRCVVLCVQVGVFVGEGSECKLCGGWCKCECVGRQKGLCGSCLLCVSPACMTQSRYVCLMVT